MARGLGLAVGTLLFLVGALWTLQGLGYIGGSFMSGATIWAIIGPVVAGLGVAMVIVMVSGRER